jgi:hypothetical protein
MGLQAPAASYVPDLPVLVRCLSSLSGPRLESSGVLNDLHGDAPELLRVVAPRVQDPSFPWLCRPSTIRTVQVAPLFNMQLGNRCFCFEALYVYFMHLAGSTGTARSLDPQYDPLTIDLREHFGFVRLSDQRL